MIDPFDDDLLLARRRAADGARVMVRLAERRMRDAEADCRDAEADAHIARERLEYAVRTLRIATTRTAVWVVRYERARDACR